MSKVPEPVGILVSKLSPTRFEALLLGKQDPSAPPTPDELKLLTREFTGTTAEGLWPGWRALQQLVLLIMAGSKSSEWPWSS